MVGKGFCRLILIEFSETNKNNGLHYEKFLPLKGMLNVTRCCHKTLTIKEPDVKNVMLWIGSFGFPRSITFIGKNIVSMIFCQTC